MLKDLSLKIVAMCVSICIFVSTVAYCMPTLRANFIFDSINKKEDETRVKAELSTTVAKIVQEKSSLEKQLRNIFESLRPDFRNKKELSVKEFENHIRLKAKELGISYKRKKGNTLNFLYYNFRLLISELAHRHYKTSFDVFLYTVIMSVAPHTSYSYPKRKASKIKITVPSRLTPLFNALAIIFTLNLRAWPFLPLLGIIFYFEINFVINTYLAISSNRILSHELKEHAYTDLIKNMLVNNGIIEPSFYLAVDENKSENLTGAINEQDIRRLEEEVLEIVVDKQDWYTSGREIEEARYKKPFAKMGFEELIWWYKALNISQQIDFCEFKREEEKASDLLKRRYRIKNENVGEGSFFMWIKRVIVKEFNIPVAMYKHLYRKNAPILTELGQLRKKAAEEFNHSQSYDELSGIKRKYIIKMMKLLEEFNKPITDKVCKGSTLFDLAYKHRISDMKWGNCAKVYRGGDYIPAILVNTPSQLTANDVIPIWKAPLFRLQQMMRHLTPLNKGL